MGQFTLNLLLLQRHFLVIPVKTGIQVVYKLQNPNWIPAFAGMTEGVEASFAGAQRHSF